jgi:hypothetical protein
MKAIPTLVEGRPLLLLLLGAQVFLVSGCTSALWDKETFAHHYQPANPVNLHLFYSEERRDLLVQYDESKDAGARIGPRYYWLEPNTLRVNRERKPHFVSASATNGLLPIAVGEAAGSPTQSGMHLYAVARHDDNNLTLYSGKEQLDPYKLPTYVGASRRVKQVLLTPFSVGVDTTMVGAVIAYYSAPQILASLSR